MLAVYLRYLLSAFPDIVIPKRIAGLSIAAFGAILVIFVGIFIIQKKYFTTSLLIPLYIFLGFMVFSGIVNFEIKGLLTGSIRLTYLIIIQLSLFVALQRVGPERVYGALLAVFTLPSGLQVASVLLSHRKGSGGAGAEFASFEESTGVNYIGPYVHESSFSIILISMLVVAMFWRPRKTTLFWVAVTAGIVGLAYANYRTAILASLPVIVAIFITRYYSAFVKSQRAAALAAVVIFGLPVMYVAITAAPEVIERFEGVGDAAGFDFTMSPREFTAGDKKLFTGRVYTWSLYFDAIANADFATQIIGHGPEAWKGVLRVYAHNTYVSYFYEFGFIGFLIFALYWISNLVLCFRVREGVTFVRLFSGYLSFTILMMATMPLWQIEGNLLLALLNGTLMYEVWKSRQSGSAPMHPLGIPDRNATKSDLNRPV